MHLGLIANLVVTVPAVGSTRAGCGTLLPRKDSIFNLGSAETKLLYTLHWLLLDAGDECGLEEVERKGKLSSNYNFPVSSITVSVVI